MCMESVVLNILGTEWIVIVFVALVLILGTGKLPAAARKMGRVAAEFEKAKSDMQNQMSGAKHTLKVDGPVGSERQKLEAMAKAVGIDTKDISTEDLRQMIRRNMEP